MKKLLLTGCSLFLLSSPVFAQGDMIPGLDRLNDGPPRTSAEKERHLLPQLSLGITRGAVGVENEQVGTALIRGRTDFRVVGVVYRKAIHQGKADEHGYQFLPVKVLLTTDSINPGGRLRNVQLAAFAVRKSILGGNCFAEARLMNFDQSVYGQLDDFSTPIRRLDIARIRVASYAHVDRETGNTILLDLQYSLPGTWIWTDGIRAEMNEFAESVGSHEAGMDPGAPSWARAKSTPSFYFGIGATRRGYLVDFGMSKWGFVSELPTRNGSAIVEQSAQFYGTDFGFDLPELIPRLKPLGHLTLKGGIHVQQQSIRSTVSAMEPTGLEKYQCVIQNEIWVRKTISVMWSIPRNRPGRTH
jgi:hypothetical protein